MSPLMTRILASAASSRIIVSAPKRDKRDLAVDSRSYFRGQVEALERQRNNLIIVCRANCRSTGFAQRVYCLQVAIDFAYNLIDRSGDVSSVGWRSPLYQPSSKFIEA